MKVIDVYEAYYGAACLANGRERHAAKVTLTAVSEEGRIRYELGISFFPHDDEEDYGVSYDAAVSRVLYEAKGRRSKKREKALMETLQAEADDLAEEINGEVFWDRLLREPRLG